MNFNILKPFGRSKTTAVIEKSTIESAVAASPVRTQSRPRVMLCAPSGARERLLASKQFEFIPCGKADLEVLKRMHASQIDGVLLHFEVGVATGTLLEFVNAARTNFPDLPCFTLCNHNDQKEIGKYGWQVIAARDLTSVSEIEQKLQSQMFFFPWLTREVLRNALVTLRTMPAEAASHQHIVKELQNPKFSLEEIAKFIKRDQAITAQLLKIVNSAAFSRGDAVSDVTEAVLILGAVKLQALILSAWAFFMIDESACPGFRPKEEWEHAVLIAAQVRKICEAEGMTSRLTETAITAALLHDIGKLLLAANRPNEYAKVLEGVKLKQATFWQEENELFGFNHAEVAGCLLSQWGVPFAVAQAVILHHADDLEEGSIASLIQKAHTQDAEA